MVEDDQETFCEIFVGYRYWENNDEEYKKFMQSYPYAKILPNKSQILDNLNEKKQKSPQGKKIILVLSEMIFRDIRKELRKNFQDIVDVIILSKNKDNLWHWVDDIQIKEMYKTVTEVKNYFDTELNCKYSRANVSGLDLGGNMSTEKNNKIIEMSHSVKVKHEASRYEEESDEVSRRIEANLRNFFNQSDIKTLKECSDEKISKLFTAFDYLDTNSTNMQNVRKCVRALQYYLNRISLV